MRYEVLLDDLLANLSKKGIDVSKLKITEEQQSVENILNDFISPSRNTTARTVQIVENKKAVTHYELSYSLFILIFH